MSDEIKNSENEIPKVGQAAQQGTELAESELEQVAGGHVVDKASPVLMQACATGTHIKEATITH